MNDARRKDLDELHKRVQLAKIAVENLPNLDEVHELLETLRDEEQDALDSTPEALQTDERREALEHIETATDTLEGICDAVSELNDNLQSVLTEIEGAKS